MAYLFHNGWTPLQHLPPRQGFGGGEARISTGGITVVVSGPYLWYFSFFSSAVSLTKTPSKGRDAKVELVNKLRDCVDQFSHLYVFSFENMRSAKFKDLRIEFITDGRWVGRKEGCSLSMGAWHYHDGCCLCVLTCHLYFGVSWYVNGELTHHPRFFLGKNKVLQKAFGLNPEDEYRDNLRHLSKVMWLGPPMRSS